MKEIFSIDNAIAYQESNWKQRKKSIDMTPKHALPFLTISREYGCLGYSVGEAVAASLNRDYNRDPRWTVYDRAIIDRLMKDMNISYELAETLTDKARTAMDYFIKTTISKYPPEAMVYSKLVETMRLIAANGHAVIIGRVGNVITRDIPLGYHVRLIASREKKIENISMQFKVNKNEARGILEKKGEAREQFLLKHLAVNMNDPALYNLTINTTDLSIDETARFIITGMELYGTIKR